MNFDEPDKMGSGFTVTTDREPLLPLNCPSIDDVMDWYSMARERGEKLTDWQKRYPAYAEVLAEFEAFLRKTDDVETF